METRIRAASVLFAVVMAACDPEPRGEPSERVREVISSEESPVLELKTGDTLTLSPVVASFYRERGYRQAWTDYDEVLDRGLALLATMRRSAEDGFEPEEYQYPLAALMLQEVEEDSLEEREEPGQMGEVDMVLSEVFARYAQHLAGGALDPRAAGLDWEIEKPELDVKALLQQLVEGADADSLVNELRPRTPEYRRMMEALARYRAIEQAGGWSALPDGELPKLGGSSPVVEALRRRLVAERDPVEADLASRGRSQPDVYDASLKNALVHFQERHGLDADGDLGERTRRALDTPVENRIAELKLNLDRWRWLPGELGELYVMVNVAGFELEVVENDSAVLTMDVVVGQTAWRTPIFRDTMEHIVINPYWNVPPNIEKDELIPALEQDPTYLERNNFEVLRGDRPVSDGDIDWALLTSSTSPYRFRQRPGAQNALGEVKFLFPNKDDIYLHDTPAQSLFSQSSRAFSHGCIRVEKPRELARLIMEKATDRSPSDYDELRARSGEQWIPLTRPIPVYILYFTAYAQRDGSVSFHADIYERDRIIEDLKQGRRIA